MRFLVDECTGPAVAKWLRSLHHDVFFVYDEARGLDDESIIEKANRENYVLVTNDKDFGELVFHRRKTHKGVILLRLEDERSENKIGVLNRVLDSHSDKLVNNFIIVTERTMRIVEEKRDKLGGNV
ncbi:putative nuclease, contains PIN domain, potential toxin-antitoxin system component [Methanophagales archaeon]|nr:putative nuclease, contains PIN domain, potential toxin-antitoxin system component [Methanophagales archaeon]